MGFVWVAVGLVVAVVIALYVFGYFSGEPAPPEPKSGWWGRGPVQTEEDTSIREFQVAVTDAELADLTRRVESWRHGEDLADTQFHYGFPVREMKKIVEYWKSDFDWHKQEEKLNSFPHFKTTIEGIDVHFLRVKPANGKKGRPLLIVHGWPGSVWEFYKLIPLLTDPAARGDHADDAVVFEVIAPSIPGYGFSEQPHRKGFGRSACAGVFVKLMRRLGHERFYAQGGDWGAAITTALAQLHPQVLIGYHNNLVTAPMKLPHQVAAVLFPSLVLGDEHRNHFQPIWKSFFYMLQESGYYHIQSTKPDTVGMALNDSPVGLAAYILEKFSTWTNKEWRDLPDGGLLRKFTLDELLTNVMIYWISQSVASSQRFYKEAFNDDRKVLDKLPIKVPVGLACFPEEIIIAPRPMVEYKFKDIVQYTYMPAGGHFAAFEEPESLANDFLSFIRKLDARGK